MSISSFTKFNNTTFLKQTSLRRQTASYGAKTVPTYVAGVDKPGDVSEGSEFPVHIAANFTVFPAVVDVDESHHVPLKPQKQQLSTHTHTINAVNWSALLAHLHQDSLPSSSNSPHLDFFQLP